METTQLRNAVGTQVQKQRSLQNLTQQDLAVRCNLLGFDIGRETISQIERGVRGVADLEMILLSNALRIPLASLVPKILPRWKKDLRPPNASP
jgi:transcriptional regulator with XRE-family HTH domain